MVEPAKAVPATEYEDLLAGLGAEPAPMDPFSELAFKDATIAELEASLARLQPLGEELADSERARLALELELEALRAQIAAAPPEATPAEPGTGTDPQAEVARLSKALHREQRKVARLEEQLKTARARLEQSRRVAAERWHELRTVRGERKRLARELEAEIKRFEGLRDPVQRLAAGGADVQGSVARIAELMQLDPRGAAAPAEPRPAAAEPEPRSS